MPDDNDTKYIASSHHHNASPDRINSEVSYKYFNVQLVCIICNRGKWLMKQDEYIQLCKAISDKNKDDSEINNDWKFPIEEYEHILNHVRLRTSECRDDGYNSSDLNYMSVDKIMNMIVEQRNKCAISGLEMTYNMDRGFKFKQYYISHFNNMSIDRKDNTLGHSMDNIQLVLSKVNIGRSDLTIEDYIKICLSTAEHYNK